MTKPVRREVIFALRAVLHRRGLYQKWLRGVARRDGKVSAGLLFSVPQAASALAAAIA